MGITGTIEGLRVAAGNVALMMSAGVALTMTGEDLNPGTTLLYVSQGNQLLGWLAARDTIRGNAKSTVTSLHAMNVETVMLTGDGEAAAAAVGKEVGIREIHAGLLPKMKVETIRRLQQTGRKVTMVGDGINDAAALAQADAGLAIGGGTDLALEAGDAILLRGEPDSVVTSIRLARQTLRVMRQNLGWALGYNLLGIPIAAGVLYPALHILLSPALASAAMAFSSVSVLANSLRLRRFD